MYPPPLSAHRKYPINQTVFFGTFFSSEPTSSFCLSLAEEPTKGRRSFLSFVLFISSCLSSLCPTSPILHLFLCCNISKDCSFRVLAMSKEAEIKVVKIQVLLFPSFLPSSRSWMVFSFLSYKTTLHNKFSPFLFLGLFHWQTCVLKVYIHCDGCKQKVKKLLRKIEGIFLSFFSASFLDFHDFFFFALRFLWMVFFYETISIGFFLLGF